MTLTGEYRVIRSQDNYAVADKFSPHIYRLSEILAAYQPTKIT